MTLREWHVTSFYRFLPIPSERLPLLKQELADWMLANGFLGLIVLAEEGINGTVAGPGASLKSFKSMVESQMGGLSLRFKDSVSTIPPFAKVAIDIRPEIVGLKRPELAPTTENDHHLTPQEWHELITSASPPPVIDTRNIYETELGKFRGAIDPGLRNFSEWGDYLEQSDLPRDEPVLIYCTGGIRCEKAILEMRSRGFEKVYQLRDGILGYLAEYPEGQYDGECYVFDNRVAVDHHLQPTQRYAHCAHCGDATDLKKDCQRCGVTYACCPKCGAEGSPFCSKNCRNISARATAS